jgi:hypothetical protein
VFVIRAISGEVLGVMAGLVPAIHAAPLRGLHFRARFATFASTNILDGRVKPGHDELLKGGANLEWRSPGPCRWNSLGRQGETALAASRIAAAVIPGFPIMLGWSPPGT